jgi:putative FmdB family regulatory protein
MPIYEYECEGCQEEFELLIRGREAPECPSCGGRRLQRLLSAPAAHTGSKRELPTACPESRDCAWPQCGSGECMGPGGP